LDGGGKWQDANAIMSQQALIQRDTIHIRGEHIVKEESYSQKCEHVDRVFFVPEDCWYLMPLAPIDQMEKFWRNLWCELPSPRFLKAIPNGFDK